MGNEFYCPVENGWQGLSETLSKAAPGDTIRLGSGTYTGKTPLTIPESVQLIGNGESLLVNDGGRPILLVDKANVRIQEVHLQATQSGQTAVHIQCTHGVEISGCTIEGRGTALEGVKVERSQGITISGNIIRDFDKHVWLGGCLIRFESSTGWIRENEVSEGFLGIALVRSESNPETPSSAEVTGNCCHDNLQAGIFFSSSQGYVEDNKCWNTQTRGGICVQRSDGSLDAPSQVDLVGNRCYDNELAGIVYLSSNGRIERNECWGSRSGSGISAQRQSGCPEPSKVDLIGNHCYDNKVNGISFHSSNGRIERNECWGSRSGSGISAQRQSDSPEPSKADIIGNRCYNNEGDGITLHSSSGRIERNECWGSRSGSGISAQRQSGSPEPSKVELIGNCCYDNENAGIVFSSINGRAEGNECWGSRRGNGILAQRSDNHSDAPTHVQLVGNRCHDNELHGILFLSCDGRAEGNECWGSRHGSGIAALRNIKSPTVDCQVEVIGNHCHDNEHFGVEIFADDVHVEVNLSWQNNLGGIAARSPNSKKAPSKLQLFGNRCFDNLQFGIGFESGDGACEDNECWNNGHDQILLANGSFPVIASHYVQPSIAPTELRFQWLSQHPLGTWRAADRDGESGADALASYLWSGGCSDCFVRFWNPVRNNENTVASLADQSDQRPSAKIPEKSAPSQQRDNARTYRIHRETDNDIAGPVIPRRIASNNAFWSERRHPDNGTTSLSALLTVFGRAYERARLGKKARDGRKVASPRWVIGFVSADEPGLEAWLKDEAARHADLTCDIRPDTSLPDQLIGNQFDMLGLGDESVSGDAPGLIEQKFLNGKSRIQRFGAWLEAILFMPAAQGVALAGTWTSASFLIFAYLSRFEFWAEPHTLEVLEKHWEIFLSGMPDNRMKFAAAGLGLLLLLTVLINRVMPSPLLRVPIKALWDWLNELEVPGLNFFNKLSSSLAKYAPTWRRFIKPIIQSDSSRRLWMRRKIYGYRWFGLLRLRALPPALLIVRNVDVPSPQLREELREILAACPSNQSVVLVTQMLGMSMLVSGFVDVWFGQEYDDAPHNLEAFIVHDLDSARIPLNAAIEKDREPEWSDIIDPLGKTLGWPLENDEKRVRTTLANAIVSPSFEPSELLLALILGSAPQIHMRVSRSFDGYPSYIKQLQPIINAYIAILTSSNELETSGSDIWPESNVDRLEDYVKHAKGLLLVDLIEKIGRPTRREWIGRVGYRVHLATALCKRFSVEKPPANPNPYLARLVACGELYNLLALQEMFERGQQNQKNAIAIDWQRVPLHAEAAVFLMMDRLSLSPEGKFYQLEEAWQSLVTLLQNTCGNYGSTSQVSRLCMAVLHAKALYLNANKETQDTDPIETLLNEAIEKPFEPVQNPEKHTVWTLFAKEIRLTLQLLTCREPATAVQLMNAKLAQDWAAMPDGLKAALRMKTRELQRYWLQRMAEVKTTDELYDLAIQMREQPALLIATLGAMAATAARRAYSSNRKKLADDLAVVADAMMALRDAVAQRTGDIDIPVLAVLNSDEANEAARCLLQDETLRSRLCEALRKGEETATGFALTASQLDTDVDCIALGIHGQLHSIIKRCIDESHSNVAGGLEELALRAV